MHEHRWSEKDMSEVIWQRDIPVARDIGITRCCSANVADMELGDIVSLFGLTTHDGLPTKIDAEQAKGVLETLLWKDMAYSSEIMPLKTAAKLAHNFLSSLNLERSVFFTNGDWYLRSENVSGNGWNSMTNSTFDGGIIAIDGGFAFCIWFQDED